MKSGNRPGSPTPRWPVLLCLLLAAGAVSAQDRDSESFLAIQQQVGSLREQLLQSTVGLQVGRATGSGVIISQEGHVLTAAHVVRSPGRRVTITMADGRQLAGRSLGTYQRSDLALVQFVPPEELTVAPLGDSDGLLRGQWVIATGHPLGPREERPPVVRIGRVVSPQRVTPERLDSGRITTDAPLISGDSGGPLWDLNGRVVGIHSAVTGPGQYGEGVSLHMPASVARSLLEALKEPAALEDATVAPAFLEPFRAGRSALSARNYAEAVAGLRAALEADPGSHFTWLLLARAYASQQETGAALDALERAVDAGYNDARDLEREVDLRSLAGEPRFQALLARLRRFDGLPGNRRTESSLQIAAARLPGNHSAGTVRIFAGRREVIWGLVVSADGDVLTKASELPEEGDLTCVFPNGRTFSAERGPVDEEWDVALLRLPGVGVAPVDFAPPPAVGHWVITPDDRGGVAGLGVMSVESVRVTAEGPVQRIEETNGVLGAAAQQVAPDALNRAGLEGAVRLRVTDGGPAARAGIRTDDLLLQIDNVPTHRPEDLIDYLLSKRPDEEVHLLLMRLGQRLERRVTLGRPPRPVVIALSGDVSQMQGPFPRPVLQHDTILRPQQMGGAVLDLEGRCIGMNIARANRVATYALPAPLVQEIYRRLRAEARR